MELNSMDLKNPCPVCLGVITDGRVVVLSCSHAICRDCADALRRISKNREFFTCPYCRAPFYHKNDTRMRGEISFKSYLRYHNERINEIQNEVREDVTRVTFMAKVQREYELDAIWDDVIYLIPE